MRRLKSVRKYRVPDYPLLAQVLSDPKLLAKLPDRWHRCKNGCSNSGIAGIVVSITFILRARGRIICRCASSARFIE